VGWLSRLGSSPPAAPEPEEDEAPTGVERASPGLQALFEGVREDGSHTLLDLGPASGTNFRLYERYARRIRFAELLERLDRDGGAGVERIPRFPNHPYDLVLGWDALDRIGRGAREALVTTLDETTAPDVRIYLTVRTDGGDEVAPLRFTILDDGQVHQEPAGAPRPAGPPLLPAEVERLLEPFRVRQAFVLRQGLREYVVGR